MFQNHWRSSSEQRWQRLRAATQGLLLVGILVACGTPPAPPNASDLSSPTPVTSPNQLGLQLDRLVSRDGFTQYVVTISGLSVPSTALLQFNLPQGAQLLNPTASNGWVSAKENAAVVLTAGGTTQVEFNVKDAAVTGALEVKLLEFSNASQTLERPMTAQVNATRPNAVNQQGNRSLDAFITTLAPSGDINSATLSPLLIPRDVQRDWLKYEVGDVDKNSKVDLDDIGQLTLALARLVKLDAASSFNADLEDDGVLTADDLTLLIDKRLSKLLKLTQSAYNVHPGKLEVSGSAKILSVRNVGGDITKALVKADAPWVKVTAINDGVHNSGLAFEVTQGSEAPTNAKSAITIEAGTFKRTVEVVSSDARPVDILTEAGKINVGYQIQGINVQGLSIQSPYEKTALKGNSGTVSVADGDNARYPIFLLDNRGKIKAVTYYFGGTAPIQFSPNESAQALVFASPFSQFANLEKFTAFRTALSKGEFATRLEAIRLQQQRENTVFNEALIRSATRLALYGFRLKGP